MGRRGITMIKGACGTLRLAAILFMLHVVEELTFDNYYARNALIMFI